MFASDGLHTCWGPSTYSNRLAGHMEQGGGNNDLSEFNRALRPDPRRSGEINSKTKKKQADLQRNELQCNPEVS